MITNHTGAELFFPGYHKSENDVDVNKRLVISR